MTSGINFVLMCLEQQSNTGSNGSESWKGLDSSTLVRGNGVSSTVSSKGGGLSSVDSRSLLSSWGLGGWSNGSWSLLGGEWAVGSVLSNNTLDGLSDNSDTGGDWNLGTDLVTRSDGDDGGGVRVNLSSRGNVSVVSNSDGGNGSSGSESRELHYDRANVSSWLMKKGKKSKSWIVEKTG